VVCKSYSDMFPTAIFIMAFLQLVKIAVAWIQLTLFSKWGLISKVAWTNRHGKPQASLQLSPSPEKRQWSDLCASRGSSFMWLSGLPSSDVQVAMVPNNRWSSHTIHIIWPIGVWDLWKILFPGDSQYYTKIIHSTAVWLQDFSCITK
jgi:hypothetical protein